MIPLPEFARRPEGLGHTELMALVQALARRLQRAPSLRPFRHRDFRLLWCGAFVSFIGSWVQNVAQGWLVYYHLDQGVERLAFVAFCSMAPITALGPFAGALADTLNKRNVLALTQLGYAIGALFLAVATWQGFVQYWHVVVVALLFGTLNTIEMPARQSIVGTIVPPDDLSAAIPLNAMTFNLARVLGPAVGGLLLQQFGPAVCYTINGISYFALLGAALGLHTNLNAHPRDPQPIRDLVLEGMKYTFRDVRLRTLFLMESTVSIFALFYLGLMAAIAKDMLGLDERGLGFAMTSIGVGAISGLILLSQLARMPIKATLCRVAMTTMGLTLIALSAVREPALAFALFALAGASGVIQFNTTNVLFQSISPPYLRGRVMAMHLWALSGLTPIGSLLFGWLAHQTSLPHSLAIGGSIVLIGAALSWINRRHLPNSLQDESG